MIDLNSTPARYRGTIEVYAEEVADLTYDDAFVYVTEWFWRCRSNNHTILGHGEGYRRKAGALNAIDAMFGSRLTDFALRSLKSLAVRSDEQVVPWRLVIVDRHHDTTTGAVY